MDYYELRRGRETLCRGTVPWLGYSKARLRCMYRDGCYITKNGKRVKMCEIETLE